MWKRVLLFESTERHLPLHPGAYHHHPDTNIHLCCPVMGPCVLHLEELEPESHPETPSPPGQPEKLTSSWRAATLLVSSSLPRPFVSRTPLAWCTSPWESRFSSCRARQKNRHTTAQGIRANTPKDSAGHDSTDVDLPVRLGSSPTDARTGHQVDCTSCSKSTRKIPATFRARSARAMISCTIRPRPLMVSRLAKTTRLSSRETSVHAPFQPLVSSEPASRAPAGRSRWASHAEALEVWPTVRKGDFGRWSLPRDSAERGTRWTERITEVKIGAPWQLQAFGLEFFQHARYGSHARNSSWIYGVITSPLAVSASFTRAIICSS